MAALIKSVHLELNELLLGPEPPKPVAAKGGVPHIRTDMATVVQAGTTPEPDEPTDSPQPAVKPALDENALYRRFMAEQEEQQQALAEKIRQEAYASGYTAGEQSGHAAGLEKGEREGRAAYQEAIALLEQLTKSGNDALAAGVASNEPLIAEIIFQAVCKIVGDTLLTPEGVNAVIERVLENVKRKEVVSLRISHDDLNRLLANEATLQPEIERLKALGLEADESIELGGCVVHLKGGQVDGRIETQFRTFAQSLKEAAQGRG